MNWKDRYETKVLLRSCAHCARIGLEKELTMISNIEVNI